MARAFSLLPGGHSAQQKKGHSPRRGMTLLGCRRETKAYDSAGGLKDGCLNRVLRSVNTPQEVPSISAIPATMMRSADRPNWTMPGSSSAELCWTNTPGSVSGASTRRAALSPTTRSGAMDAPGELWPLLGFGTSKDAGWVPPAGGSPSGGSPSVGAARTGAQAVGPRLLPAVMTAGTKALAAVGLNAEGLCAPRAWLLVWSAPIGLSVGAAPIGRAG